MDNILETRADVPINAIHMHSGYKADLCQLRVGIILRESAFRRRQKIDLRESIGEIFSIHLKISSFTNSGISA